MERQRAAELKQAGAAPSSEDLEKQRSRGGRESLGKVGLDGHSQHSWGLHRQERRVLALISCMSFPSSPLYSGQAGFLT